MAPRRPSAAQVEKALRQCERELMTLPGVTGVAVTESGGRPHIAVYVERATKALRARIPRDCDGIPVKIEESGRFKAL